MSRLPPERWPGGWPNYWAHQRELARKRVGLTGTALWPLRSTDWTYIDAEMDEPVRVQRTTALFPDGVEREVDLHLRHPVYNGVFRFEEPK